MMSEDSAKKDESVFNESSSISGSSRVVPTLRDDSYSDVDQDTSNIASAWSPSGSWRKDLMHFVGPGWLVSIAYVDPGNYQADIQAGATGQYKLLFAIWWTSILSIYVQILCVRLAYFGKMNLAEAQKLTTPSNRMRYMNWLIAEGSTILTDLPEVIGIGIALKTFFGWDYYIGVLLSLLTTLAFLSVHRFGVQYLELIAFCFVGIMSFALWLEMDFVGYNTRELLQGWVYGFVDVDSSDIFTITGILGAVVMPHNLYLHSAACQSRPVHKDHVREAVRWSSWEPTLPILLSFFVNVAVVSIAAQSVYGTEDASEVGLTDFCDYFARLKAGCAMWGVALLAAGQSSAITTTYTGQYIMDGFLNLQIPIAYRAIFTRLTAITPCVFVSILFPNQLNQMINLVNSLLSLLLPFALTPLVKFNCSETIMGPNVASKREAFVLHMFAFFVWLVNAVALSATGGGYFANVRSRDTTIGTVMMTTIEIGVQAFYAWWNFNCIWTPIAPIPSAVDVQESQDLDRGSVSNGVELS